MTDFARDLEARLVRYAAVDTQSDETSATSPSTAIQLNLSRMLADELRAIGASDVRITDYGAVLAVVPSTAEGPSVGLLAHVDTAPAYHAVGVKPVVHRGYNGGAVRFSHAPAPVLSPRGGAPLSGQGGHDKTN